MCNIMNNRYTFFYICYISKCHISLIIYNNFKMTM